MNNRRNNIFARTSILLVLCSLSVFSQADTPFRMRLLPSTNISLNTYLTTTTTLTPFNDNTKIYGLSIDAIVTLPNERSVVRVVLEDENGNEYLVLESSRRFCDSASVSFTAHCEETNYLKGIQPKYLHVSLKDASISIQDLHVLDLLPPPPYRPSANQRRDTKIEQTLSKVNAINSYNVAHGLLWSADTTSLALMTYAERKRVLGCSDDDFPEDGFAYYSDGIFSSALPSAFSTIPSDPRFTKEFSWTNRHGKNWMTFIKDQGKSSMCVFFATAAVVEALVNLYHNKLINLELSVPELAYYGRYDSLNSKEYAYAFQKTSDIYVPAPYVVNKGVSRSTFFPFTFNADVYKDYIPSLDLRTDSIRLSSWHAIVSDPATNKYLPLSLQDSVKACLIKYGPIVSGMDNNNYRHSMALVGYRTLCAGDKIKFSQQNTTYHDTILTEGSPYIGQTAWYFKDSKGIHNASGADGYCWILFSGDDTMSNPIYFKTPVLNWPSDTVRWTDADGDGYYYWGIGERPAGMPSWIPQEPDGDDADYTKGPIDAFGNLLDFTQSSLHSPITVAQDVVWNTPHNLYSDIIVQGATLTITANTQFYNGHKITLQGLGSKLIIDGCTLTDVIIDANTGSAIEINDDGRLVPAAGFELPLGVELLINEGSIY